MSDVRPSVVTVEQFMAEALYAPGRGYYMREGRRLGREGDFSTSVTLHPALGTAVLHWALARAGGKRLVLVEVGAGGGHLAAALLDAAGWWRRRRIDYRIVEISPSLQDEQRRRLGGRRVHWFGDLDAAVRGVERPLVFSNELVDAFPCRQFQWREGAWHERVVSEGPRRRPVVHLAPTEASAVSLSASALAPASWPGGRIPEGQIVEVHASYRAWLGQAGKSLQALGGHLLTIDYGDEMPAVYERRRGGTLRAYFQHQRLEGEEVFGHPGVMDLTADVNFTDLQAWGREVGLETRTFESQRSFLRRWLPRRVLEQKDPALAFVLDEDGAGQAFKVLWQEPDAPAGARRSPGPSRKAG